MRARSRRSPKLVLVILAVALVALIRRNPPERPGDSWPPITRAPGAGEAPTA